MNLTKLWIFVFVLLLLPITYAANEINSTDATGLIGYEELNSATPLFRTWDSANFSSPGSSLETGVNTTDDITWTIVKGSHERDEMIMATEDKGLDINVQIYQSNSTWGFPLELTTDISNSAFRSFDIDYEDLSGDALIVYESSSTADSNIAYRIWNGTDYSSESTLTTSLVSANVNWIDLISKRGTDTIMLLVRNRYNNAFSS